jgi:hypothetical protein
LSDVDALARATTTSRASRTVSSGGVMYLLTMIDESPALLLDVFPRMTLLALGLATLV